MLALLISSGPLLGRSVADSVDIDPDVERAAEDLVTAVRRRVLDEPWVLHAAEELADPNWASSRASGAPKQ
jgi:hypothetical protein